MSYIYHIRPDNTVGICKAKKGKCPLGKDEPHFNSIEEAEKYRDSQMKNQIFPEYVSLIIPKTKEQLAKELAKELEKENRKIRQRMLKMKISKEFVAQEIKNLAYDYYTLENMFDKTIIKSMKYGNSFDNAEKELFSLIRQVVAEDYDIENYDSLVCDDRSELESWIINMYNAWKHKYVCKNHIYGTPFPPFYNNIYEIPEQ